MHPNKSSKRSLLVVSVVLGGMLAAGRLRADHDPDLDDDGRVTILDISRVASCVGLDPAAEPLCASADIDHDGDVDLDDVSLVAESFGRSGFPTIALDTTPPPVTIESPANLAFLNQRSITVSGTTSDDAIRIDVNGAVATLTDDRWSIVRELREGNNTLTVVAVDAAGNTGTASVQVSLDTTPPRVTIDSPPDGLVTSDVRTSVTGMINDIVVGTVNEQEATVRVNGRPAVVSNRSFHAAEVPLEPGENEITATGTDRAGNVATSTITVIREAVSGVPMIRLVAGDGQSAVVGQELAEPLVAELLNADGGPVVGIPVVFRVHENNGILMAEGAPARCVAATTDARGQAVARWRLGSRAGAGNNRVQATAARFAGTACFTATALCDAPAKLSVDAGDDQLGCVGLALPRPFAVIVTDTGHNRLGGVPVTFGVVEGGGNFGGETAVTVLTDGDGRAAATLTLGPEEGFDNNLAEATFEGNPGFAASFFASGRRLGKPEHTRVRGVVLDNTNAPLAGATLSVVGTELTTRSDAEGQFLLAPAPVGLVELVVDGSTIEAPGPWPRLVFELVTVPGQDNTVGMPIYLLPLTGEQLCVDEDTGGVLTMPDVPGFSLTVAPDSATFLDGSRAGCVSVTVVHADKMPMAPSFGQQPTLAITIQPVGVAFDPPAAITLPNTDGLVPGEVTDLYSFDHELGQFVSIGTGTVSEDGTMVRSDPGVGVLEAGWHCGGNPAAFGSSHDCGDCSLCQLNKCVPNTAAEGQPCEGQDDLTIDLTFFPPANLLSEFGLDEFDVTVTIDRSCLREGVCKAGVCVKGDHQTDSWDVTLLRRAVFTAISRFFTSECIGEELRREMQFALFVNNGMEMRCVDSLDSSGNDKGDCASSHGPNLIKLSASTSDTCKKMGLDAIVFHEMFHSLSGEGHETSGDVTLCGEDPTYGCQLKCFGGFLGVCDKKVNESACP